MPYRNAIKTCGNMLSGRVTDPGAARRLSAPLISFALGAGAEDCLKVVEQTYQDCWSNAAAHLHWLKTENCLQGDDILTGRVDDAFMDMRENPEEFQTLNTLKLAYFWDLMDDRFPEIFQAVQTQIDFGAAINVAKFYFLFVRQVRRADRENTGRRLREVIDWAKENGEHLIVQSDRTDGGGFGMGPMYDGYRAAANVVVIANSVDANGIGRELEFKIMHSASAVWSLGAYTKVKETDEIACAAMEQILTECLQQAQVPRNNFNIQELLCGAQKGYDSLFREYVDTHGLLPDVPDCLRYLPYTREMAAFEKSLSDTPSRGLFRKSHNRTPDAINSGLLEAAVASVQDIWKNCVDMYYRPRLQELQENPKHVREQFEQLLCSRLSYGEMNNMLLQEVDRLREHTDWDVAMDRRKGTLPDCLHRYACCQILPEMFNFLSEQLCEAINDVCGSAKDFGQTLVAAQHGLRECMESVDETIRTAYAQEIVNLPVTHPELGSLVRLTPCDSMEKLLEQLEDRFQQIVSKDENFRRSLFDELKYRSQMAGGDAIYNETVRSLFDLDMTTLGRLKAVIPPDGGELYCMLSQPDEIRGVPNTGKAFRIPRQDYVDRLYIYPLDEGSIIYN